MNEGTRYFRPSNRLGNLPPLPIIGSEDDAIGLEGTAMLKTTPRRNYGGATTFDAHGFPIFNAGALGGSGSAASTPMTARRFDPATGLVLATHGSSEGRAHSPGSGGQLGSPGSGGAGLGLGALASGGGGGGPGGAVGPRSTSAPRSDWARELTTAGSSFSCGSRSIGDGVSTWGFSPGGPARGGGSPPALGLSRARGAPRGALLPLAAAKLTLRSNIGRATVARHPDFGPGSVMAVALEYELPARDKGATLSSSLLADPSLKPTSAAREGATSSPTRLGTYQGKDPISERTIFTTTARLPHHHAPGAAGSLDRPSKGGGGPTFAELLLRVLPHATRADEYTFDVPADVVTGEDAVKLFASSRAKPGLIVLANLNPETNTSDEYNPYDLLVVAEAQINPAFYFILSQTGVTMMWDGTAYEQTSHSDWMRDRKMFELWKKLVMFKRYYVFQPVMRDRKMFELWKKLVCSRGTACSSHMWPLLWPLLWSLMRDRKMFELWKKLVMSKRYYVFQTSHSDWMRDRKMFELWKKLVMFKKYYLFQAFRTWRSVVRAASFRRRQTQIASTMLLLSPTFGPALLDVRRMALSVTDDPAGTWKRVVAPGEEASGTPGAAGGGAAGVKGGGGVTEAAGGGQRPRAAGGGSEGVRERAAQQVQQAQQHGQQVQMQAQQQAQQSQQPARARVAWVLQPWAAAATAARAAVAQELAALSRPQSVMGPDNADDADSLGDPGEADGGGRGAPRVGGPSQSGVGQGGGLPLAAEPSELPEEDHTFLTGVIRERTKSRSGGGGLPLAAEPSELPEEDHTFLTGVGIRERTQSRSGAAPSALSEGAARAAAAARDAAGQRAASQWRAREAGGGARVAAMLLGAGEAVPRGGLPLQLGRVGDAHAQYSLPELTSVRSEAKAQVQLALHGVCGYVVERIQAVGMRVKAALHSATAATATPNKKQARDARLQPKLRGDAWKVSSPTLAKEGAAQRTAALAEAQADRQRFLAFVGLSDALLTAEMRELARGALAVWATQLLLHRPRGLITLTGAINEAAITKPSRKSRSGAGASVSGRISEPSAPPALLLSPREEDVMGAVRDDLWDTLGVAVQGAAGLRSSPDLKIVMRSLFGTTGTVVLAGGGGGGGGGAGVGAGGAPTLLRGISELFRSSLGLPQLQAAVEAEVGDHFQQLKSSEVLQLYHGHARELWLVRSFKADSHRDAAPDALPRDIQALKAWALGMLRAKTRLSHGLLVVDVSTLRDAFLPGVACAYAGLMARVVTVVGARATGMLSDLEGTQKSTTP
ncbi:hypothetical protein FOA52_011164 [Chlamydomonas sp. UWO 241]|nr:hypothetical protein FOA52_011164 [Chlamydomonas sp. UWO 241]